MKILLPFTRSGTWLLSGLLSFGLSTCGPKADQQQAAAPGQTPAAAPAAAAPAANQLRVVESALAFDFNQAAAQAGQGPYDVILVAVRSRLPFVPRDGSTADSAEAYYAEALCRGQDAAGLQLQFYGVPLVSTPNPGYPGKVFWRTAASQLADLGSGRHRGPQWASTGSPTVARYSTTAANTYSYPRPYACQPTPAPLSLYHDPRQQVYEYKLKSDLALVADTLSRADSISTQPTGGFFVLGIPKLRQYLAGPAPATRAGTQFSQTIPGGTMLYGGTGQPVPAEVFGIFRAYTLRSVTVPHHLPGQPAQRWLFVTIDQTATRLPAE